MLTADLVRATTRRGILTPLYVDLADSVLLERAAALCTLHKSHVGRTRAELDEALQDLTGEETDFLLTRGLAKLLDDRSTWEVRSAASPEQVRAALFDETARCRPIGRARSPLHPVSRDEVIARVAEQLGLEPGAVEASMYADLDGAERMAAHDPIEAAELLSRYNLALAQGVLLRAVELRIDVSVERPAQLRELFRYLKFHQLLWRARRGDDGRWRIHVDGPASLFGSSSRYGVQMAKLLPAAVLLPNWRLEADIAWRPGQPHRLFRLESGDGLATHLRSRGSWISSEERGLVERIAKAASGWSVEPGAEVIDLNGQEVLVPDLRLVHAKTGRVAWVDVVGFWRADWFRRRLDLLVRHGPPNLVVCLSRRLCVDAARASGDATGESDAGIEIVDFAEVISASRVLAAAERVGVAPG